MQRRMTGAFEWLDATSREGRDKGAVGEGYIAAIQHVADAGDGGLADRG